MKKLKLFLCICVCFSLVFLASCEGLSQSKDTDENEKLKIVTTIFPSYDFAREIVGEKNADIKMLLKPGAEAHSYEPTPKDIIDIQNCDIFVYVGGESDEWVKNILASLDMEDTYVISMMDCVDVLEEEVVEGMQVKHDEHDGHEEEKEEEDLSYEPEYDEHIWTSPINAIKITEEISAAIIEKDSENKEYYINRTLSYTEKLRAIDRNFREIVENSKRKTIIFGDRFPCRYFADEYGLKYYAAFPGCSSETEASAKTVAFLIDKVNDEDIPVVMYPELSNMKVAKTICESSSAVAMRFNSCHNVTADEFKDGATYLSLMQDNAEVLKRALN